MGGYSEREILHRYLLFDDSMRYDISVGLSGLDRYGFLDKVVLLVLDGGGLCLLLPSLHFELFL